MSLSGKPNKKNRKMSETEDAWLPTSAGDWSRKKSPVEEIFDRKLRMKIGIDEHNRRYNLRKYRRENCEQVGT